MVTRPTYDQGVIDNEFVEVSQDVLNFELGIEGLLICCQYLLGVSQYYETLPP